MWGLFPSFLVSGPSGNVLENMEHNYSITPPFKFEGGTPNGNHLQFKGFVQNLHNSYGLLKCSLSRIQEGRTFDFQKKLSGAFLYKGRVINFINQGYCPTSKVLQYFLPNTSKCSPLFQLICLGRSDHFRM